MIRRAQSLISAALILLISSAAGAYNDTEIFTDDILENQCNALPHLVPGLQDVYTVGVLAIRGVPAAYAEFNKTFSEYLTATAGSRFERPVRFEMKPLTFESLFSETASSQVDFFYVNPSAYSCIESEFGAHSLVSQISKRVVGGKEYDLTQFGGVIFTRANSTIEHIADIKDKVVAAASISGLGSGQMQFRKLMQSGLHYLNDPSQVVFTSNQDKIVNGVLNGEFDVGFVRTDQIERTEDESTGELVDRSLFKVIDPMTGLESDGAAFPFESSTQLYAEWNVAALNHVPNNVNIAVQEALVALMDHADVGDILDACDARSNCVSKECMETCNEEIPLPTTRCETTPSLARLASAAKKAGKYSGFRSTLTYMELRNMQEETGFISKNPTTGVMQCIRSKNLFDAVVCPPNHFKKSPYEVLNGCELAGTPCPGYQCLCKPCVKAYDVNIFPLSKDTDEACDKFAVCGQSQQREELVFLATDNKEREGMKLSVKMHIGEEVHNIIAEKISPEAITKDDSVSVFVKSQVTNYTQMFKITSEKVGVVAMEVFAYGEQIPESPFRIEVGHRDCSVVGENRIPDINGNCACSHNTVERGGICAEPSQTTARVRVIVRSVLGALSTVCFLLYVFRRVRAIHQLQRDHVRLLIALDEATQSTSNLDQSLDLICTGKHAGDVHKMFGMCKTSNMNKFTDFGVMIVFFTTFIYLAYNNVVSSFIF